MERCEIMKLKNITAIVLSAVVMLGGSRTVTANTIDTPSSKDCTVCEVSSSGYTQSVDVKMDRGEEREVIVSVKSNKKICGLLVSMNYARTGITLNEAKSRSLIQKYGNSGYPNIVITSTELMVSGAYSVLFSSSGQDLSGGEELLSLVFYSYNAASKQIGKVDFEVLEMYDADMNEVTDAEIKYTVVEPSSTDTDSASSTDTSSQTHTHTVVIDPAVSADCTHTGLTEGSHCSVCGAVIKQQKVTAKTAHKAVTDPAVPADCTHTGLTAGSHCSVCGEVIKAQKVTAKTSHRAVTDKVVAATCTQTGLTAGSHCSVCGEVIKAQEVTQKTAHRAVKDKAVAATCTHTGLTEGSHCSVCGEVIKGQEIIPMTEHKFVNGKCSVCGISDTNTKEYTYGDVNNDGTVHSSDALAILRYSVGLENFSDIQLKIADVDTNNSYTAGDALEVLRYSVGYSSSSHVGQKFRS